MFISCASVISQNLRKVFTLSKGSQSGYRSGGKYLYFFIPFFFVLFILVRFFILWQISCHSFYLTLFIILH